MRAYIVYSLMSLQSVSSKASKPKKERKASSSKGKENVSLFPDPLRLLLILSQETG